MSNKKYVIHISKVNQPFRYSWACKNNRLVIATALTRPLLSSWRSLSVSGDMGVRSLSSVCQTRSVKYRVIVRPITTTYYSIDAFSDTICVQIYHVYNLVKKIVELIFNLTDYFRI